MFIVCETLILFPFALFSFHLQDLSRRACETKTTNSQKPHPSCACVFYNHRVFVVQCLSESPVFPFCHDSLDQRSSLRARCSLASKSTLYDTWLLIRTYLYLYMVFIYGLACLKAVLQTINCSIERVDLQVTVLLFLVVYIEQTF